MLKVIAMSLLVFSAPAHADAHFDLRESIPAGMSYHFGGPSTLLVVKPTSAKTFQIAFFDGAIDLIGQGSCISLSNCAFTILSPSSEFSNLECKMSFPPDRSTISLNCRGSDSRHRCLDIFTETWTTYNF